jgi:hypothetical protein
MLYALEGTKAAGSPEEARPVLLARLRLALFLRCVSVSVPVSVCLCPVPVPCACTMPVPCVAVAWEPHPSPACGNPPPLMHCLCGVAPNRALARPSAAAVKEGAAVEIADVEGRLVGTHTPSSTKVCLVVPAQCPALRLRSTAA